MYIVAVPIVSSNSSFFRDIDGFEMPSNWTFRTVFCERISKFTLPCQHIEHGLLYDFFRACPMAILHSGYPPWWRSSVMLNLKWRHSFSFLIRTVQKKIWAHFQTSKMLFVRKQVSILSISFHSTLWPITLITKGLISGIFFAKAFLKNMIKMHDKETMSEINTFSNEASLCIGSQLQ